MSLLNLGLWWTPSSAAKLSKIVYQKLVTVYTLGGLFSYTPSSVYVANFYEKALFVKGRRGGSAVWCERQLLSVPFALCFNSHFGEPSVLGLGALWDPS